MRIVLKYLFAAAILAVNTIGAEVQAVSLSDVGADCDLINLCSGGAPVATGAATRNRFVDMRVVRSALSVVAAQDS